jgi:hypothetical protein
MQPGFFPAFPRYHQVKAAMPKFILKYIAYVVIILGVLVIGGGFFTSGQAIHQSMTVTGTFSPWKSRRRLPSRKRA